MSDRRLSCVRRLNLRAEALFSQDFACGPDCTTVAFNEEAPDCVWSTPEDALALPIDRYTVRAIEALVARRNQDGQ